MNQQEGYWVCVVVWLGRCGGAQFKQDEEETRRAIGMCLEIEEEKERGKEVGCE